MLLNMIINRKQSQNPFTVVELSTSNVYITSNLTHLNDASFSCTCIGDTNVYQLFSIVVDTFICIRCVRVPMRLQELLNIKRRATSTFQVLNVCTS